MSRYSLPGDFLLFASSSIMRWMLMMSVPLISSIQLITNERFKDIKDRVLASARILVVCFFSTSFQSSLKLFGPIRELSFDDSPPIYKETTVRDYLAHFNEHGLDETSPLKHFKL